jgi:hypothetical protein
MRVVIDASFLGRVLVSSTREYGIPVAIGRIRCRRETRDSEEIEKCYVVGLSFSRVGLGVGGKL